MMASQSTIRISREVTKLSRESDLSLAVAFDEKDIRNVKALIVGPPGTPYESGFFLFAIKFGNDYPNKAPSVIALTTNRGRTRFNPNIYADGKVCLSILGTWRGEPGEEWSAAQSLESILISIQSLMGTNPFENEPGFENRRDKRDREQAKEYALKVHHESIRISVLEPLESSLIIGPAQVSIDCDASDSSSTREETSSGNAFLDLCKRRFTWYYSSYLDSIDRTLQDSPKRVVEGKVFPLTPFEGGSNNMQGRYMYADLKRRLKRVREELDLETDAIEAEGLKRTRDEAPRALFFQNSFKTIKLTMQNTSMPVDLELIDDNPFAWRMTLFGRPMTNLDGGMFKIKIVFPFKFPEHQPRVRVETPLFHQRITTDGILAYIPTKHDEIEGHISSIISTIEDENPPYDPRMVVHPEASALRWGTPDQRKVYNRKLRRSAQDSTEC